MFILASRTRVTEQSCWDMTSERHRLSSQNGEEGIKFHVHRSVFSIHIFADSNFSNKLYMEINVMIPT